jgi:hypothetical protein
LALACGGIGADFDLTGLGDGGLGLFSVRHGERVNALCRVFLEEYGWETATIGG